MHPIFDKFNLGNASELASWEKLGDTSVNATVTPFVRHPIDIRCNHRYYIAFGFYSRARMTYLQNLHHFTLRLVSTWMTTHQLLERTNCVNRIWKPDLIRMMVVM